MASANDDTDFVFALLVEVFRITIDWKTHFFGCQEFRIIGPGVHTKYNCGEAFVNACSIPTEFKW